MLEANGPSFYFSLPYEETLGLQDLCASGKLRPRAANKGTCRLQGFLVKDLMSLAPLHVEAPPKANESAILCFGLHTYCTRLELDSWICSLAASFPRAEALRRSDLHGCCAGSGSQSTPDVHVGPRSSGRHVSSSS